MQIVIDNLAAQLEDPEARARDANDRADSAYRTRDAVVRALSYVEEAHHSDGPRNCSCGRSKDACTEFKACFVARDFIAKWESRNRERMKQGKAHDLPSDHPVVTERDRKGWEGGFSLDTEYARASGSRRD